MTYEYSCPNCGKFETTESMKDRRLETCPKCGAKVQQVFSSPGVVYKALGFYTTDNRADMAMHGQGDLI